MEIITFQALNPLTNQKIFDPINESNEKDINSAAVQAKIAFYKFRKKTFEHRAKLLETIAEEIMNLGNILLEICQEETALPNIRLNNERNRTCMQLRMFANVIRKGIFLNAIIDTSDFSRLPIPKPDTRYMKIPIGPVAIFGASNFPLAFSVAGGDTASALAAGCPVIVKAHPAHPNTSNLVASAIHTALTRLNFPDGIFQLIHGKEYITGKMLVQNPVIKAVGFTGSQTGGLSLLRAVQERFIPIPVYAEMGSSNPIFLLPGSIETDEEIEKLSNELVTSITLGMGQFCTQPGIIFILKNNMSDILLFNMKTFIENSSVETMLTPSIASNYKYKIKILKKRGFFL